MRGQAKTEPSEPMATFAAGAEARVREEPCEPPNIKYPDRWRAGWHYVNDAYIRQRKHRGNH